MDEIFSQIANLGFPIVVSIYLLVRIEAKLDNLTVSITELSKAIENIKRV
ncbi:YvrJ family protein [Calorimonas adulescens]|uniref:YvrJ family protein n=1 Tax=Calorimonas adulescens TaxID=2606906 RepID=A0A5D8QAZ0_9THEO|nr:YvrJ family protein [Calorimonas adulescens]TZE81309.1 YvrJ family protein [Calorimonas adulescens]